MKGKEFYNKIYSNSVNYDLHYSESLYFKIYEKVLTLLDKSDTIIELGCGTGQFAQYLEDNKCIYYIGFDFSDVAINKAKSKSNQCFMCLDILTDEIKFKYDTIIALEVFEHLYYEDVLKKLMPGKKIIFSLPNFKTREHIYAWGSEIEIRKDFEEFVNILSVEKVMQKGKKEWYLINGIVK
jgi:SAM-dependent methyltransferase